MKEMKMGDLPKDARPYEKCMSYGVGSLTDVELLAVCLRNGSAGQNVLSLAREILAKPGQEGLQSLLYYSQEELCTFHGIGKVKSIELSCIAEIARRLSADQPVKKHMLNQPEKVVHLFGTSLCHCSVEQVWMIALDTKNNFIAKEMVTQGTVNSSIISPREVFLCALKYQAVSIILVHNHPSGDPSPSNEDIQVTKRLITAGNNLGITLLDHIIIGNNAYYSMKEQGYMQ